MCVVVRVRSAEEPIYLVHATEECAEAAERVRGRGGRQVAGHDGVDVSFSRCFAYALTGDRRSGEVRENGTESVIVVDGGSSALAERNRETPRRAGSAELTIVTDVLVHRRCLGACPLGNGVRRGGGRELRR